MNATKPFGQRTGPVGSGPATSPPTQPPPYQPQGPSGPPPSPRGGPGQPITLEYIPQPGLGGLSIKNFLLTIITLGIYSFWGKTNVRKHIWSCVHLSGEPLEYTGTGKELFIGMLIVVLGILLPLTLLQVASAFLGPLLQGIVQFSVALTILFLVGIGIYRARRYRLSRTVWRGIRGTLAGSPTGYAVSNFWMTLTLPFTLMWTYPWMRMRLTSKMTNDMMFGSELFRFGGSSGPLYKRFAICWVIGFAALIVPTLFLFYSMSGGISLSGDNPADFDPAALAIYAVLFTYFVLPLFALVLTVLRAIYISAELNHFARCTGFQNIQISMNATTWSLIGLAIGNFFILVLSLGIAMPYVQQRLMKYMCDRLDLQGTLDVAAIQQSQATLDRRGEGLAEAFDIDAF